MKRIIRLMSPRRPLQDGELEQCEAEYEGIWANGFIPFVRQYATISETPDFIRVSSHRAMMGLYRVSYLGGDRPGLETEWRNLEHLATVGYRTRHQGGLMSIILFKPEYQQKIPREILPHEWEGLDKNLSPN